MSSIDTFCPTCWKHVQATIEERQETSTVRGDSITCLAKVAVCPHCGEEIGDSRLEGENIEQIYDSYRCKNGIPFPSQIKARRAQIGLHQESFSKLLGIGEASLARYESGSLPTESNARLLKAAMDDALLLQVLQERRTSMSSAQYEKARKALLPKQAYEYSSVSLGKEDGSLTLWNGNRAAQPDYIGQCIAWLAGIARLPYKTRVLKALFIADYLSFEKRGHSISGLAYACMPFGPMVSNHDLVISVMVAQGYIMTETNEFGTIIKANRKDHWINDEDAKILETAMRFIDSFNTVEEISESLHSLESWKNRKSGELIEFRAGAEVSELVEGKA